MNYIKAFKDTDYIVSITHNEAITINVGKAAIIKQYSKQYKFLKLGDILNHLKN